MQTICAYPASKWIAARASKADQHNESTNFTEKRDPTVD